MTAAACSGGGPPGAAGWAAVAEILRRRHPGVVIEVVEVVPGASAPLDRDAVGREAAAAAHPHRRDLAA